MSWKITPLYFFSSNLIYLGQKYPIKMKFLDFWVFGEKFTKFLMSYLKMQVSFSLDFASLLKIMRDKTSVLFSLKLYMVFTKEAHQSAKFQTFHCSVENSPNLYFHRLILLKVYKIQLKKYRGVMSHDTEVWCQIWRKTNVLFQEWQEFGEFWSKH